MKYRQSLVNYQLGVFLLMGGLGSSALANAPPSIPYALINAPYCGSDTNAAYNSHGGAYNQATYPSTLAFAALNEDGSIKTWADDDWTEDAPTDSGYVSIVSSNDAFAALKADGSITAWGNSYGNSSSAPTDRGYISISSRPETFAALRADGSITAWQSNGSPDPGAPGDSGYLSIASNYEAFAALKNDGSITAWGQYSSSGSGAPTDDGYTSIASTAYAFAALKSDGSITAWGAANSGGSGAPTDSGYISITSANEAFAALKADGSITAWGEDDYGGSNAPTDIGYVSITSNRWAFAAFKSDGSITSWGWDHTRPDEAPTDTGYVSITANASSFAALKADGSISSWGESVTGDAPGVIAPPTESGYVSIFANDRAFAALRGDGSIASWGVLPSSLAGSQDGSNVAPSDSGYIHIASVGEAFVAMKADGSLTAWGSKDNAQGVPMDTGYVSINGSGLGLAEDCSVSLSNVNQWQSGKTVYVGDTLLFSAVAEDADANDTLTYSIKSVPPTAGIPSWLIFDTGTGTLSGKPDSGDIGSVSVVISVSDGTATASLGPLNLTVAIRDYDQDGVGDAMDAFPYDPAETLDTDGDGLGDNADGDTAPNISAALSRPEYCGSDYNTAYNRHGGFNNQGHVPNIQAFSALHKDGTITVWGVGGYGGSNIPSSSYTSAPTDSGYTRIVSAFNGFSAFKTDGSVTTWGGFGNHGVPTDSGYIVAASTVVTNEFAVLKADGSIATWSNNGESNVGSPTDSGYLSIASNLLTFAALKTDGSITAWMGTSYPENAGQDFVPRDDGYVGIASTLQAFAALKADGSITSWGQIYSNAPADNGYISISSNDAMFAALKADGSIASWGGLYYVGGHPYGNEGITYIPAPTDSGYVSIASNRYAFAALKADGSITAWGQHQDGGVGAPTDSDYVSIASTLYNFAALKADGSITAWGSGIWGGDTTVPTDSGYVSIASNHWAYAALKADGSIAAWGSNYAGGSNAPTDSGYIHISSTEEAFVAMKADGSLTQWGRLSIYGDELSGSVPTGNGYISVNGSRPGLSEDCSVSLANVNQWKSGKTVYVGDNFLFSALAEDADNDPLTFSINKVPSWASFDPVTGTLSGTPGSGDVGMVTVVISVTDGNHTSSLAPLVMTVAVRDYDQDEVGDSTDAFPYDSNETLDTDGDGLGNNADPDDDNDGVIDANDVFPNDPSETIDTDGDGIGNNGDAFPSNPNETLDTDNDGVGNNTDTDDDNDGMPDSWELANGLDPLDNSDANTDVDSDNIINLDEYRASTDPQLQDSDGDGINDDIDQTVGSGLWGYACNVVSDPNSSTRRWGINQYNLADLPNAVSVPVYSMSKNRTIQSVACTPSGDTILFSMKDSVQGDYEIYELETANGFVTQITDNDTDDADVTRSRDGRTVAWQMRLADGRQAVELRQYQDDGEFTSNILASANPFVQPSLSPNGEWLTFVQLRPSSFAVMRYDILNGKYKEVRVIARRKKLYHPSITDDGNKIGWTERTSMLRYRVKDLVEDITTDVVYDVNGVEHAVLSGDGKHIIYSVNTPNQAQTYLIALDTLGTTVIGETLTNPVRYLSNNWLGNLQSSGFELNQVTGRHLRSVNQSMTLWLRNNGSGVRYTLGSDDAVAFTWQLDNGVLILTEQSGTSVRVIRLLTVTGNQFTVSMISPDGRGGVVRQIDTLYQE